jgi:hypothetical protein
MALSEGNIPEPIENIEEGVDAEIKKEIENKNKKEEGEEEEEEETIEEDTIDLERLTKEDLTEMSSNNKRLKDVVDEYMTELENAESKIGEFLICNQVKQLKKKIS